MRQNYQCVGNGEWELVVFSEFVLPQYLKNFYLGFFLPPGFFYLGFMIKICEKSKLKFFKNYEKNSGTQVNTVNFFANPITFGYKDT